MADWPDDPPLFVMVMGCNGCGKSIWKRYHRDDLPPDYLDLDSIAEGLGSWDSEASREKARNIANTQMEGMIRARHGFGCESTFSGARGPELLQRMESLGYELHGVFLGTEDPAINIRRIQWRVDAHTGHWVSSERIAVRWHWALSNLRKHAVRFDRLSILDNSADDVDHAPVTRDIASLEKGRMAWSEEPAQHPEWFREWLSGFEHRQKDMERLERKRQRGTERMHVSRDRESGPRR